MQAAGGPLARARANIEALCVLKTLEADGREPTGDERAALVSYSGWGGAPDAFRETFGDGMQSWADVNFELRELLTDEEYIEARSSTLTAFYTPAPVIEAMVGALGDLGFGQGRGARNIDHVLEPGCGTGNFMSVSEAGDFGFAFDGVEIDRVSSRIAAVLHPQDAIVNASLDACYISKDSYDAVLGNVPYSDDIKLVGPDGRTLSIHDCFIEQSIDALRPGGVAALLTSRYTMDKANSSVRRWVAERAELIAAVRLPEETFMAQAGTSVVSDVLVFKKREHPIDLLEEAPELHQWVESLSVDMENGDIVHVNAVFFDHPERIVGEQTFKVGRFGYDVAVSSAGADAVVIGEALRACLGSQLDGLGNVHDELGKRAEQPICAKRPDPSASVFEYYLDEDQNIWYGNGEVVEAVSLSAANMDRLRAMVHLRDELRDLLAFERTDASDEEVANRIAAFNASYDSFVEKYGHVNDAANRRVWDARTDYSFSYLRNTEETDALGRFVGKAGMLSKRVQVPAAEVPDHFEHPQDALAVSLDRFGRVDMDFICRVCNAGREDVIDRLGDSVVIDPDTSEVVAADEYLSGDVLGKIEHVEQLIDKTELSGVRERDYLWEEECGIADIGRELSENYFSDELKRNMQEIGGAWTAATDPDHADRYLNVNAAYEVANDKLDWRGQGLKNFGSYISDLHEGAPTFRDGEFEETLWERFAHYVGRYNSPDYDRFDASFYLLREAAHAEQTVISDEAFASLLLYSNLLSNGRSRELFELLDSDELRVPSVDEVRDIAWHKSGFDGFMEFATAVRNDDDLLDYMLLCAHGRDIEIKQKQSELRSYSWSYRQYRDIVGETSFNASLEGFTEFKERKRGFDEEHPVAIDHERVSELRELRKRLVDVAPAPLAPTEISVNLGAPWIPLDVYYKFAEEAFQLSFSYATDNQRTKWLLSRSNETGTWQFKRSGAAELRESVLREYGTPDMNPISLMESALNGSTINITKPDPDDPEGKRRVGDPVATAAAYRARDKINAAFKEWVFSDDKRAARLAGIYNRQFNCLTPRRYDGSYLSLPGSNPAIELRKHQKDAVARILHSDEGSLVAHVVGAGKTFAGVASIMEAKRIGKASKPLVVVPNHLTEQWASDFLRLYPDARVLYMTQSDLKSQDATRAFWARAAMGDWDAVIVAQSRFDMLHLSNERRIASYENRVEELVESIQHGRDEGKEFSVKQLEGQRKRMQRTLDKLRESPGTEGMSFEEVGFDFLFVDEAHNYKNLAVVGRSVAGMSSTSSAKCENLIDICDYLRERGCGSNIVFATGTPVSNTMSELYNMERYLAPGLLRRQGTYFFSDWAQSFGETVQSVEVKPEGTGFQMKERFARFHNLPELMAGFHSFADIMTQEDLDLDVPEVEAETVAVEADEEQRFYVELLGKRADRIRGGGVDPSEDNMLKITFEGRALALSTKLLDGSEDEAPSYGAEGGKLKACAENIKRVYDDTYAERGTQLVFCDASTPASGGWNVYDEIKAQLVGLGIPEDEIAFVHDAGSNLRKRDELFEKVNEGKIRVLFGSTQKLGTGTNVQSRLAAIHDVDCPWRPSDLEQRLGRIQRQGNRYDAVRDFRYVTSGTFDSYLYQTVERKQRFISQVFTNRNPARSGDDLDETVLDYATIKAVASGDPTVRERLLKENRLQELELQRQSYGRMIENAKRDIARKHEPSVNLLTKLVNEASADSEAFDAVSEKAAAAREQKLGCGVVIDGIAFDDRNDAAKAILAKRNEIFGIGVREIGTYFGLPLSIVVSQQSDTLEARIAVSGKFTHEASKPLSLQVSGSETCVRQIERIVSGLSENCRKYQERLETARENLEQARITANMPWECQEEYDSLKRELAEAQLSLFDSEGIGSDTFAEIEEADEIGEETGEAVEKKPSAISDAARNFTGKLGCGKPETKCVIHR